MVNSTPLTLCFTRGRLSAPVTVALANTFRLTGQDVALVTRVAYDGAKRIERLDRVLTVEHGLHILAPFGWKIETETQKLSLIFLFVEECKRWVWWW